MSTLVQHVEHDVFGVASQTPEQEINRCFSDGEPANAKPPEGIPTGMDGPRALVIAMPQ